MIQEDQGQCSSQAINNNFETYHQEQFLLQQQQQMRQQNSHDHHHIYGGGRSSSLNNMFHGHEVSPILQPWSMQQLHNHHHHQTFNHDNPFLIPQQQQQQQSSSPYASLFNRRVINPSSLQFAYDNNPSSEHLRIISDTVLNGSGVPFGLQGEIGKMSAQEIMEAKALAASKSHSEAERRRRERINNHLAKLRSLLPSTTKVSQFIILFFFLQPNSINIFHLIKNILIINSLLVN